MRGPEHDADHALAEHDQDEQPEPLRQMPRVDRHPTQQLPHLDRGPVLTSKSATPQSTYFHGVGTASEISQTPTAALKTSNSQPRDRAGDLEVAVDARVEHEQHRGERRRRR